MNIRILLCVTALALAGPAFGQEKGMLKLPEFAALADKASESVTVTLDSKLLGLAARFLDSDDPEQAQAQKLVASLTGVYVRSFTFDTDYAYPKSDIDGIRRQLSGPGWSRIVEARSRKEHTDVDVFMLVDGGKARGLAIIASEPREFTIVNVVGTIDLEQLHELEGNFGVPDLQIETGKKPATTTPNPPKK
jgi:hypothetical protein